MHQTQDGPLAPHYNHQHAPPMEKIPAPCAHSSVSLAKPPLLLAFAADCYSQVLRTRQISARDETRAETVAAAVTQRQAATER